MCKVTALAMPQVNWSEVSRVTEITDGESILRELDRKGIDQNDPQAVQHGLNWEHIYYTFAVRLQTKQVWGILDSRLTYTVTPIEDGVILILSASLKEWQTILIDWLKDNQTVSKRIVGTQIYNCFRGASITEPWADLSTRERNDHTITLGR